MKKPCSIQLEQDLSNLKILEAYKTCKRSKYKV
jgi:hypothetical protein